MTTIPPPMAMLAELTHRCPLMCPYCSNPLEMTRRSAELDTAKWADVFAQAAEMGVLHVHLSGGEPVARKDLEELTAAAAQARLYTNLITSGIGLTEARLKALVAAGLEHVQLSVQGADPATADRIGGYKGGFAAKMQVAAWVAAEGLPLTVNAVMHRQNLDQLEQMIELTLRLGARRLEVANTQYHGWALKNRAALLPTAEQFRRAAAVVAEARERLQGRLVIDYVPPDYHATYPKACMGGWGRVGLVVTPSGKVLPCHAAESLKGMEFETVGNRRLADIWADGAAFRAFRGEDWMQEPCRSCDRRDRDFGGCRCQAFAITGDARAADPVCTKSPHRHLLDAAIAAEAARPDVDLPVFAYRRISG